MKRQLLRFLLLTVLTALAKPVFSPAQSPKGPRPPQDASSAETELRAVMAERHKASVEGDAEKIASSMADDYIQTDIAGYVQDKTTWLNEYFKPLAELIKAGKFHWDVFDERDVQVRMYDNAALVIGTMELKGSGARPTPQHTWLADSEAHPALTLRFTRIYIRRNGKWLLAALHNAVPLPPPTVNKEQYPG